MLILTRSACFGWVCGTMEVLESWMMNGSFGVIRKIWLFNHFLYKRPCHQCLPIALELEVARGCCCFPYPCPARLLFASRLWSDANECLIHAEPDFSLGCEGLCLRG